MNGVTTGTAATTQVDWQYRPPATVDSPLRWTGPYVECKLEHPQLEPTCPGTRFFPDSVPYRTSAERRVFYWRRQLSGRLPPRADWSGICGTTHELTPLTHGTASDPTLCQSCDDGDELVVDGAVVGDSRTALVSGYSTPAIEIRHVTPDCVELTVDGTDVLVPAGSREQVELAEQTVETAYGVTVPTRPELVVRFPGRQTVYHPAPAGDYWLFPSFGLDVELLPRPVDVRTDGSQLDHDALAATFGIDIASRPYPERILWQAFVLSAFDPATSGRLELTQFPSETIAVRHGRR